MSMAKTTVAVITMLITILVVAVPVVDMVSHEEVHYQNSPLNATTYEYNPGLARITCTDGVLKSGSSVIATPTLVSVLAQGDNFALMYASTNNYALFYKASDANLTVIEDLGDTWSFTSSGNSFTVSYTDGENASQTVTGTTEAANAISVTDANGKYVAIRSASTSKYVNDGSKVFVCITAVGGKILSVGSVEVGAENQTAEYYTASSASTVPVTIALTDNGDGSYTIGSVKYTLNGTDTSYTGRIIPVDYYAEGAATGPIATLVGAIPLLLAVGVLIAVVASYMRRD